MAISCKCPHCGASYRLKDEFAGKKVTCKTASCRKLFEVPKPKSDEILMSTPVDVDAMALAAFSDEPAVEKKVEAAIKVTCAGCDHIWEVEAAKAGKNVQCPECGKINKALAPKVTAKIDWKDANAGRPTFAAPVAAPKVAGAFDAGDVNTISMKTAQEIVRDQDAQEEPEEVRKRWIKRSVYGTLFAITLVFAVNYGCSVRNTGKMDSNIADALKEVRGEDGPKDAKYHALVLRASGEFHGRASESRAETDAALNDFKAARNVFPVAADASADRAMMLSDVALSMAGLLGTDEEAEKGKKIAKDALLKEIRQTIDRMQGGDPEPIYDLLRQLTREFHKHKLGPMAAQLAVQKFSNDSPAGQEAIGVVGLELLRLGDREAAGKVLEKTSKADATSVQVLRKRLDMEPTVAGPTAKGPAKGPAAKDGLPTPTQLYFVLLPAIQGEMAKVKVPKAFGGDPDRAKAMVLAAEHALPADPKAPVPPEVNTLLEDAAALMAGESKNAISPWWTIRACRLFGRIGKLDRANAVAELNSNQQTHSWAKLEGLRAHLNANPDLKVDETILTNVGEPATFLAAAKARELVARHNAGIDNKFENAVKAWPKGSVRPFGTAGLILGQQDRNLR